MNYSGRPQGFAPTGKINASDGLHNNYELCIMHYELIITRTSVRLYEDWIHQMRGGSNNYALRIMNYEFILPSGILYHHQNLQG